MTAAAKPLAAACSDVEVRILDPRIDPEPSGWPRPRDLGPLPPMWDYRLLRLESWLSRNPPVLAVLQKGGRALAACTAMLCGPARGRSFAPRPADRRRRVAVGWAEVYVPWFSGHSAVVFGRRAEEERRRELLRLFERALAGHVGPGLLGVVYRAMPSEVARAATGPGRASREIDPTTVLLNRWESVEDWMTSLRPPMRDIVRQGRVAAAALEVTTGAGRTDLDAAELATLLGAHRARQDERAWRSGQRARIAGLHLDTRSAVPTTYLDALVRREDVLTRTYRDSSGRLLAFQLLLDHPDSVGFAHWAALPAEAGGRRHLYADAYAHGVEYLIGSGRAELTAGRTLLDLKAGFGFDTRTLYSIAVPRPVMGR